MTSLTRVYGSSRARRGSCVSLGVRTRDFKAAFSGVGLPLGAAQRQNVVACVYQVHSFI
jgi:hypothetical protein